jgi:translation initiation factor IF-2
MTMRVYEVARDLGMKGQDLADKINALSLGFSVNNHMTALNEEQVEDVKRALDREARENMVEERLSATVIRRKPKRAKVVDEPPRVTAASLLSPPPLGARNAGLEARDRFHSDRPGPQRTATARLATQAAVEEPAPAVAVPAPPVAEPAPGPPPLAEVRLPEPGSLPSEPSVTASLEDASPPVEEPDRAAERVEEPPAAEPTPASPARSSVAPEAVAPPVAASAGEEGDTEERPRRRRRAEGPGAEEIVAAMARKEAAEGRRPKTGAQVTGMISPELLQARLAADNKSFGPPPPKAAATAATTPPGAPGPASAQKPTGTRETFEADQASRRKRKRTGKKVYGQSELYDRRSNRRRPARKGLGSTTQLTTASEHKRVIKMEEAILVSDLAHQMGVKAGEIALKLMMEVGIQRANINTPLDHETAQMLAEIYGYTVERVGFDLGNFLPNVQETEEDQLPRPPVVTVMGHVDHGKTSLLDAIRATHVAEGEAGGITQHIGAYRVSLPTRGDVVFLDTPGHEAFTALRARGAQATDIVVLVVAADDGVMPQTVEAINHARAAEVPIVVAINKIDKAGANPDRVTQALSEYNLIPEAWGGETLYVQVSAIENLGIDDLLEAILLQAEVLELKGNPNRPAVGLVIESRLDIGRGPIATVLIQDGTLRAGDIVSAGANWGRVRALTDDKGRKVKDATPSIPVEITGLDGVPEAGEKLYVLSDEKRARTVAEHISEQQRQAELAKSALSAPTDLQSLTDALRRGEIKELKLIIKADVQGSEDALRQALTKLSTAEVEVKIVHSAVGGITENDINLAASSSGGAVIIGFNVRPESRALQAAEQFGVQVLTYAIIYDATDAVKKLLTGMLAPTFEEHYLGRAEVRDTFGIPKVGTVAGCLVIDGNIKRGSKTRILRDSRVVYQSTIASLRRFKEDVREVRNGFECGIMVENFNDVKVGDVIETFEIQEVRATMS